MKRPATIPCLLLLAVLTAGCSAGFSKPKAEALVERDNRVYAFVDPDPNMNTETTVARLQVTEDGRRWEAATGTPEGLERIGQELGDPGVAQECDEPSGTCYRIVAPDDGLRLDRSLNGGQDWEEVWSIRAGRLEFQDRCCGSRAAPIRDLEYVPATGLVAVALGEYGLLTRGTDAQVRIDPLGRPARPESGLMVGLYVEPLFAGFLALTVGWVVTEQRLNRMRNELEQRFGSDGHTWLTGRARQVPIMLPFAALLVLGGTIAVVVRFFQALSGDPPQVEGWISVAIATLVVVGVTVASRWLHQREWEADALTASRAPFGAARKKSLRAHTVGAVGAFLTLAATMGPLIAWSTGAIDTFRNTVIIGLVAAAVVAGAFVAWEASQPPIPE